MGFREKNANSDKKIREQLKEVTSRKKMTDHPGEEDPVIGIG